MSEPSQLIVRIPISEASYREYLDHRVEPATSFEGVTEWLSTKQWYGNDSAEQIASGASHGMTVREWVSAASTYDPAYDHYDAKSETWTFAQIEFSENFGDYATALNVLRQAAPYQDRDGTGYIAIIPHYFGGGFEDADAILEIRDGKARFIEEAPPEFIAYTLQTFERMEQAAQAMDTPGE